MAASQIPVNISTPQTSEEEKNISLVKEYMAIAYSPSQNKGRSSVAHLCTADSTFTAPTTFPKCHTPLDYADSHAHVMAAIADLHIASYDYCFAKNNLVLLRYSAEGSHCGEAHNGIEASGRKAKWSAAAIFECVDGKIKGWTKEWDKLNMWKQLGWMRGDEYV